jgi:hypothetical protein
MRYEMTKYLVHIDVDEELVDSSDATPLEDLAHGDWGVGPYFVVEAEDEDSAIVRAIRWMQER